ncbi:hypothetical protein BHM03_00035647 [Ensete ventricosum]|nr:hypothetical protein BHM03_00035647 [Ensete ventricosum]
MRCGGARSPFPLIWRKISVHVELRGVVDGHNRLKSNPSTLLLEGPEVGLRHCFARGCAGEDLTHECIANLKAATCSVGSKFPLYDSRVDNLKLVGIGLSCISGAKSEPHLELSLASSFDFVTSFYISSNCLFTRRSYARSESVESNDNVSGSYGAGSTPRYGSCLGSRWRDCDLRDGHDSRSRWVWLFDYPVGEETGKTILRHDPPSSAKCWGVLQVGRPFAFALSCRQPPAIKGTTGWSARHVRSAMQPAARCQRRARLVGPSRPLCHLANRPLSEALQAGRPVASALPCG